MTSEEIARVKQELRDEGYNIYVYSYPAGMCFPEHQHDYAKLHIVLNGSIRIVVDGEEHVLNSGQRLHVPAHTRHSAEVLGDANLICIDASK